MTEGLGYQQAGAEQFHINHFVTHVARKKEVGQADTFHIKKTDTIVVDRKSFVPKVANVITSARIEFVKENKDRKKDTSIAYPLEHDTLVYQKLAENKYAQDYKSTRERLNSDTKMQLETHIGERLNVCISKFKYRLKEDGQLLPEMTDEPMLNMIKRGRDHRRNHGKQIDWQREDAEVTGFENIQKVMADRNTPDGTMMLSISPQGDVKNGSIYGQNFYDVYKKTKKGIEAYRFTSGLTTTESQVKVRRLDKRFDTNLRLSDYEFLSQPIRINPKNSNLKNPQAVHDYMHKEHAHMSKQEFDRVIGLCAPLITAYISTLCDNPYDLIRQEKTFNALLNFADIMAGKANEHDIFKDKQIINRVNSEEYVRQWIPSMTDINSLSGRPVRSVITGCGASHGSNISSLSSPYSVVEFSANINLHGSDKYGSRSFKCPNCHKTNVRPVDELLELCQNCGSDEISC